MENRACVVRLELWLDGDSPNGRAIGQREQERRFAGWMGLVAAVESLLTDAGEGRIGAADDGVTRED